jgi:hypothetical protein
MTNSSIKVCKAALDETPDGKEIILRGVLDPNSLQHLQRADYQREILPLATIAKLMAAFENGNTVPDIDLGMRGQSYTESADCFTLADPVFIIDGLQRVTAGIEFMQRGGIPHLGATIHFNTSEVWERERFRILNSERAKLSPNVLLRNLRHDIPAINALYVLTNSNNHKGFVLNGRVSWQQRMTREELMTALSLAKVAGVLHSHLGPGRSSKVDELARGIGKIQAAVGPATFRDNLVTFYDVIDSCWGIKRIAFKEGAVYMRLTFQSCLAMAFSRHTDFWKGNRLVVDSSLRRKIAQFPVTDPHVIQLASSSGKARDYLLLLLVNHINNGKRTRRLTQRDNCEPLEMPEDGEE